MTATIYIMDGCEYCVQLKANLSNARIPYNVTYSDPGCGFRSTPGTYLNGKCYGYPNYDINAQYNVIAADHSPPTAPPTPTTAPVPKPAAAPAPKPAAEAKAIVWAKEELTVKWGGISGTAARTYEDLMLEATNPVPPDEPVGLTIALRSHKKAPTGRKIT